MQIPGAQAETCKTEKYGYQQHCVYHSIQIYSAHIGASDPLPNNIFNNKTFPRGEPLSY